MKRSANTPPGIYILEEVIGRGQKLWQLRRVLELTAADLCELLDGSSPVTPEIATELARFFGTSDTLWLNLQEAWKLATRKESR